MIFCWLVDVGVSIMGSIISLKNTENSDYTKNEIKVKSLVDTFNGCNISIIASWNIINVNSNIFGILETRFLLIQRHKYDFTDAKNDFIRYLLSSFEWIVIFFSRNTFLCECNKTRMRYKESNFERIESDFISDELFQVKQ